MDSIQLLEAYCDEKNYTRTCLYLLSCSSYLPEPDDAAVLRTAYNIYLKVLRGGGEWGRACRWGDCGCVRRVAEGCGNATACWGGGGSGEWLC